MVQCQSCGGRYNRIQADGLEYYHRCPPLSVVELTAAVNDGRVTLPKGETPADAIQRRVYERANLRNENRASTDRASAGVPLLEGAGVVDVLVPVNTAPVVVVAPAGAGPATP